MVDKMVSLGTISLKLFFEFVLSFILFRIFNLEDIGNIGDKLRTQKPGHSVVFFFFLRDFIFKKTLFEKLQFSKILLAGIDVWRVGVLLCGALLFLSAPSLARNLLFHYFTGGLLGVVGSFLILVFLLSKFLPKVSCRIT